MDQTLHEDRPFAPASTPPRSQVHPLVALDYPVRVASHLLILTIMASVLVDAQPARWAWIWLGFTGLFWAHVAVWIARRARDSKACELRNLLADNLLVGGFAALSGFSLWPSVMMFIAITAANLSVGGPAFAARGVVAVAIGSLSMLSLTGIAFTPDASLFTSVVSAAGLFLFCVMLGLYSNVEARRALRVRREVQAQNLHIDEQHRQVQRARDLAEAERAAANEARDLAEAANRAKSAFLANMSHELRTPLNAIIGYAEMLEEDADDAGQRADLQKIHTSGKHLLGLINDVLDLSKIEAGRVELEIDVLDVGQLIDQVASTMRPLLDKSANRFELRLQPQLGVMTSDATRIRQVLLNLLSNAAKFTHGGEIILAARREAGERGGWLEFDVMDSGIGMSPGQLLRLFQPFMQADANTTRLYGGTGLGLVISRRLCRLMGGDVTVDSEPGHGTRFTVRLPSRAPDTAVAPQAQAEPSARLPTDPASTASRAPAPLEALDDEPWRAVPQPQRIISQGITAPAVFRISPEGTFLNMNAAMARLFGYGSPAHMLAADVGIRLFASPEVWPEYRRRLLNEGTVLNFEFEGRRADGSLIWLSQDACAVRDHKGKTMRFECFAKDITELKRTCLALSQRLGEKADAHAPVTASQRLGPFALDLPATPALVSVPSTSIGLRTVL